MSADKYERADSTRTRRIDVTPDPLVDVLQADVGRSWTLSGSEDVEFAVGKNHISKCSDDSCKLLESVYDGVLITDPKGSIIQFNSRALQFFRCDAKKLSGTSVLRLVSGAGEPLLDAIRGNLEDHRYTLIEARCLRLDKTLFPAEIAVNRIDLDVEGALCFFVRDISVRKQAQEALEKAVAHLEEHDKARSEFISNVSHELRTPLTSMIYSVANMLRGVVGDLPDRIRGYLEMLDGDCRRLLNTVNDILDLRKLEDHTLELERSRVPVAYLVQRTAESLVLQARQKAIDIDIDAAGRWFVDGDARKLERSLLNIVGNAVKFTPDGGNISVVVGDDPQRDGHVLISVRDTGVGIPREALSKVTRRYFVVGEQTSGSGLGLAISSEIVNLHGGHFEVTSPPAGCTSGTEVAVSLPIAEPPLVLIVDDDASVCDLLRQQVEREGYRALAIGSGFDALEIVQEKRPDALVVDIALPRMDGVELIVKMKGENILKRLPVIVVSGIPLGPEREQILKSLGIPVMKKPWDESEFLEHLAGVFLGSGYMGSLSLP